MEVLRLCLDIDRAVCAGQERLVVVVFIVDIHGACHVDLVLGSTRRGGIQREVAVAVGVHVASGVKISAGLGCHLHIAGRSQVHRAQVDVAPGDGIGAYKGLCQVDEGAHALLRMGFDRVVRTQVGNDGHPAAGIRLHTVLQGDVLVAPVQVVRFRLFIAEHAVRTGIGAPGVHMGSGLRGEVHIAAAGHFRVLADQQAVVLMDFVPAPHRADVQDNAGTAGVHLGSGVQLRLQGDIHRVLCGQLGALADDYAGVCPGLSRLAGTVNLAQGIAALLFQLRLGSRGVLGQHVHVVRGQRHAFVQQDLRRLAVAVLSHLAVGIGDAAADHLISARRAAIGGGTGVGLRADVRVPCGVHGDALQHGVEVVHARGLGFQVAQRHKGNVRRAVAGGGGDALGIVVLHPRRHVQAGRVQRAAGDDGRFLHMDLFCPVIFFEIFGIVVPLFLGHSRYVSAPDTIIQVVVNHVTGFFLQCPENAGRAVHVLFGPGVAQTGIGQGDGDAAGACGADAGRGGGLVGQRLHVHVVRVQHGVFFHVDRCRLGHAQVGVRVVHRRLHAADLDLHRADDRVGAAAAGGLHRYVLRVHGAAVDRQLGSGIGGVPRCCQVHRQLQQARVQAALVGRHVRVGGDIVVRGNRGLAGHLAAVAQFYLRVEGVLAVGRAHHGGGFDGAVAAVGDRRVGLILADNGDAQA